MDDSQSKTGGDTYLSLLEQVAARLSRIAARAKAERRQGGNPEGVNMDGSTLMLISALTRLNALRELTIEARCAEGDFLRELARRIDRLEAETRIRLVEPKPLVQHEVFDIRHRLAVLVKDQWEEDNERLRLLSEAHVAQERLEAHDRKRQLEALRYASHTVAKSQP